MATRIILVRHGQSLGNLEKRFLGHTDWDLTELGYKQAELTAEYLKDEKIDAIYASDLKRAFNTANAVAKSRNMEIIKSRNFREIFAGDWEAETFDGLCEKYPEEYGCWRFDIGNARCTGGESVAELQERVLSEFRRIASLHKGQTVLVGTHATPIRVLKCKFTGVDIRDAKNVPWSPNASITIVDADKEEIIVDGYNGHLGDLATALPSNV